MRAIVFKYPTAQGLRVFENELAATQAGEDVGSLVSVGGVLIKWPQSLGTPPDQTTLDQWEAERIAAVDLENKKQAALKAMEEYVLEKTLNDPSAPQAVKDYKQAQNK